jgi:hypothetical protein
MRGSFPNPSEQSMRERELLAEVWNLLTNFPADRRIAPGGLHAIEPARDPAKSPSFHREEVLHDKLILRFKPRGLLLIMLPLPGD